MRCACGRSRCGGGRAAQLDIGTICVTIHISEQREYLDWRGRNLFAEWRASLDPFARTRISMALLRLRDGNVSHVKGVGKGVSELKIDFGPGYRVYFGRDGSTIVILLGGGIKKTQQSDIEKAYARWTDYKYRRGT